MTSGTKPLIRIIWPSWMETLISLRIPGERLQCLLVSTSRNHFRRRHRDQFVPTTLVAWGFQPSTRPSDTIRGYCRRSKVVAKVVARVLQRQKRLRVVQGELGARHLRLLRSRAVTLPLPVIRGISTVPGHLSDQQRRRLQAVCRRLPRRSTDHMHVKPQRLIGQRCLKQVMHVSSIGCDFSRS